MNYFKDLLEDQQSGNTFALNVDKESRTVRLGLINRGTQPVWREPITSDCHNRAELKDWLGMLRQELDEHEKSAEQVFDEWEQKRNCPEEETEIPDSLNLDDLQW